MDNTPPTPYSRSGKRLRRFVFTLPNWTQEEYEKITSMECTWLIVGKETSPETGTPHLQGACILGTQMPFSQVKTLIGSRAHIEPMAGKPEDSQRYCRKEDSNAFEKGTMPSPGKRNDIHIATGRILEGQSVRELAHDPDVGAVAVVKYHKGLTILRSLVQPPRDGPPKVFWLFGPTGTGKTRCAFESARILAGNDNAIWISPGNLQWFDGYDGQPVAIFDDFRAKDVRFAFLLRLLDRYPMCVPFKGGFVNWTPQYIYITCPDPPPECFATRFTFKPEDIRQLERRITMVCNFRDSDSDDLWKRFVESIVASVRGESDVLTGDGTDRLGGDGSDEESLDLDELSSP